jgi:HAD superfamily hydrolase (TIGR01509 family)
MSPDVITDLTAWAPSAVVFDCDGLLVDTEPCWTVAETELFARRGFGFGPAEKAMVIGKSVQAAAEELAVFFDEPGTATAIGLELLELVEEVVDRSAQAMSGAAELVARTMRRVPVAVASNSPRGLLDAALRRAGLTDLIRVSVAADEVAAAKPAPDMYLAACAALKVPPASCLAFEDSLTGVRSARAAGMRIVGIPTLRDEDFPADIVFPSLVADRLLAWIETW